MTLLHNNLPARVRQAGVWLQTRVRAQRKLASRTATGFILYLGTELSSAFVGTG